MEDIYRDFYHAVLSAVTLILGLTMNGFIMYALTQLPSRYQFPRSEKVFLMSMAFCGLGTTFLVVLPTFVVAVAYSEELHVNSWPSEYQASHWCQGVGILGIIFMTASSWFVALLSINRCIIITHALRREVTSSKRHLAGIQAVVWLAVTLIYVVMFVLVDAEVGLPDFTKVPVPTGNESNNYTRMNSPLLPHLGIIPRGKSSAIVISTYHDVAEEHFHSKATFTTFDPFTAISCGPNWRQIPNYLYLAIAAFFGIPICCTMVSYIIIARIAYRQVRSIRSIRMRPSVGSELNKPSNEPFRNLTSQRKDHWLKHATLAAGAIGMPQPENDSLPSSTLQSRKSVYSKGLSMFRKKSNQFLVHHKTSCSIFSVFFVFSFTWSSYFVYFVVESANYYAYLNETLKANTTTSIIAWESRFTPFAAYVSTWIAVAGRNWSVLVFAMLNRKFRFFVHRRYFSVLIKKCFGKCSKARFKRSNKVAPIVPRVLSNRLLAAQRAGFTGNGIDIESSNRAAWAVTSS